MVKKKMHLEENLKSLEEILKTWNKFRKRGKNFQKTYVHPDNYINIKKENVNTHNYRQWTWYGKRLFGHQATHSSFILSFLS